MQKHLSFEFKGHVGYSATPSVAFNYAAKDAWDKCESVNGISALRLYGEHAQSGAQPAIGLDYYTVYPSGDNGTANWTATSIGSASWLTNVTNVNQSGVAGCYYVQSGAPATRPRFVSNAILPKNSAFAIKFYLFEPSVHKQLVAWQWGSVGAGWRFELCDGEARLCQMAAAWNQSDQTALDALRQLTSGLTQGQSNSIRTYEATQFDAVYQLDIGMDKGNAYNRSIEVIFIPEPRGRLHCIVPGIGETTVESKAIVASRAVGTMWTASALTYSLNWGATFWQMGRVYFRHNGRLTFPAIRWFHGNPISSLLIAHNGQADTSQTGTSVTADFDETNSSWPRYLVNFTGNGTTTPFLYSTATHAICDERNGDNSVFFDTEMFDQSAGITEFQFSCEGEKRRLSVSAAIDNAKNFLELPELGEELADRLCDVYLDGVKWLGNLLVRNVSVSPIAINDAGDLACNGETQIRFEMVDMETQADDDVMRDDPVLDGLKLGEALWQVLRGQGWMDSELDINRTAGPTLPSAALGEAPAVRPDRETRRGNFVDYLMDNFGIGYDLDSFGGAFTLYPVNTTPVVINAGNVWDVEISRDNSDVRNIFPVEGDNDLNAVWDISESYRVPTWEGYKGRQSRAETRSDMAQRTFSSLVASARTTARREGKPGRFISFKTVIDSRLLPRSRVTVAGVDWEIERISPDNLAKEESMQITARRVIAVP